MKVLFRNALMVALTASLASAVFGVPAAAQGDDTQLKGVYREAKRQGVKVTVFRGEGTSRRKVAHDYEFKSGDAFELDVETNRPAYVYVLNRTIVGNPDELSTKGIERVRDDDRRDRRSNRAQYSLLYPQSGEAKATTANKPLTISDFQMDKVAGVEKLLVVYSAKPIDVSRYFDLKGKQRTGRPASGNDRADGGKHTDTEEDVLDQLNKNLADWGANAESSQPKGVTRDPEGVGVVRDGNRPAMYEVTLRHFAR